jgi:hypothetical protein
VLQQSVDERQRGIVVHREGKIHRGALQVAGHEAHTHALGDGFAVRGEFALREIAVESGTVRIRDADLHGGIAFAQCRRHARERAAGSHGADEGIDLALGLRPDFCAGGVKVHACIGRVVELPRPDRTVGFLVAAPLGHALGDMDVMPRAAVGAGGHQDELSAEHFQLVDLLLAGALRHHDPAPPWRTRGLASSEY